MNAALFDRMAAVIDAATAERAVGRVHAVTGSGVHVAGLTQTLRQGDRLSIVARDGCVRADVVRLQDRLAHAVIDGPADGIAIGDAVQCLPQPRFAPDQSWIGRLIDPDGLPLDGRPLLPGLQAAELQCAPPPAHRRRGMGARQETGLAVMNTLLPLVRGQRIGLFAGSGVGKSTLLADLARGMSSDVTVIALVGERGREVRHFIQDVLGPEGMRKTIVVAATSDRAPQVRRRCAWAATAIAEHFRDQGEQVLLLVDSVTRYCEAHREISVVGGELANLRGYPPSTAGAIAALCERAGPGCDDAGDITAVYSVLVAGSDMDEPVADMLRGVLDGHIVLDRKIAERGRFPAIDVLRSVSRSLPGAADRAENAIIAEARKRLATYDQAALMIRAGLYEAGSDPEIDAAIACHASLEEFLAVRDRGTPAAHFAVLRQALSAARTTR
ncbi:flagellum-specific ATP synthase [Loktanella fryxellensis]|uniref:Flagellum-specific ATP synthase n=1 Tax=Loktanella fryxellensis TaxID=245187 RepID=A0A1H7ZQ77_9RHOB|nr:flagellum-specific ATP synthase [Loktanella fryxellensis]